MAKINGSIPSRIRPDDARAWEMAESLEERLSVVCDTRLGFVGIEIAAFAFAEVLKEIDALSDRISRLEADGK